MKKNSISILLIVSLISILIILVVTASIKNESLYNHFLRFSSDNDIKASTLQLLKNTLIKIFAFLAILNFCIIIIFKLDFKSKINDFLINNGDKASLTKTNFFQKNRKTIVILSFILFAYFIGVCFLYIFNLDIGADEGGYISSVKNFYEEGKFNIPESDYSSFGLQLLYYPFFLIKPIFSFSVYSLRIIVLIYSSLLIIFLYYFYNKKYSLNCFLLLLILLISDRSFIFVSSSGFGEVAAFLFLLIGLFLWTENMEKSPIVPAIFLSFAGLTKLQLLPFMFAVIILFMILEEKYKKQNLLLLIYICIFGGLGYLFFSILQGYSYVDIAKTFWALSKGSALSESNFHIINKLAHVNYFFNSLNLIIFALVGYFYFKNFYRVSMLEKALFIMSFLMVLWWIFIVESLTLRNLTYPIIINYILFSFIINDYFESFTNIRKKIWLSGALILFLFLNCVNSVVFHLRLLDKGFSDEVNFSVVGHETFSRWRVKSGQREFFEFINENIDPDSEIFYAGVNYYFSIFTEREFTKITCNTREFNLPKNSYVILTYIDYKNDQVWEDLIIFLHNNAQILFKKNFYEIYRINK